MNVRSVFIGLAALAMALVGAYFSIQGLAALFAGAGLTITIMAAVMEFSKLVTASFLYLYWKKIAITMKLYLTTAVTVLVFITSIGIYGFLTSAFQTSSQEIDLMNRKVEVLENRKDNYEERLSSARTEAEQLDETISSLSEGLAGNTVQYVDQETGQLVTTTSGATRRAITEQLNDARNRRADLTNRVDAYTDSVITIDERILQQESSTDVAKEIGPLQFIADVSELPISTVVNVLALLITFSFDPLAISLVVAFNMSIYYNKLDESAKEVDDVIPVPQNEDLPDETVEELEVDDTPTIEPEDQQENEEDVVPIEDPTEEVEEEPKPEPKKVEEPQEEDPYSIDSEINFVTPQHAPVKIDGTVVGYDTNGDGMVDKWSTNSKRNKYQRVAPFYAKAGYDWKNDDRWKSEQSAVNYWIRNIKNKSSRYPDDFNSKTY